MNERTRSDQRYYVFQDFARKLSDGIKQQIEHPGSKPGEQCKNSRHKQLGPGEDALDDENEVRNKGMGCGALDPVHTHAYTWKEVLGKNDLVSIKSPVLYSGFSS